MPKAKGGIEIKHKNYMQLGKFMINMTMLHNNELLVKYLSYAPVYKIKRRKVSDNFRDIILNLFDTNEMNYQLGKKLSIDEKNLLDDLINRCGLKIDLKFDKNKLQDNISDIMEDYKVLRGEIIAGNNNPELIQNIKLVIEKLVYHNKLSEQQANEIIDELDEN